MKKNYFFSLKKPGEGKNNFKGLKLRRYLSIFSRLFKRNFARANI